MVNYRIKICKFNSETVYKMTAIEYVHALNNKEKYALRFYVKIIVNRMSILKIFFTSDNFFFECLFHYMEKTYQEFLYQDKILFVKNRPEMITYAVNTSDLFYCLNCQRLNLRSRPYMPLGTNTPLLTIWFPLTKVCITLWLNVCPTKGDHPHFDAMSQGLTV